jgi:hypothetical protein
MLSIAPGNFLDDDGLTAAAIDAAHGVEQKDQKSPERDWAGRDPISTAHPTSQEAHTALVDYVRLNWESEMDDEELPLDEDELVEAYFATVPEFYEITEVAL